MSDDHEQPPGYAALLADALAALCGADPPPDLVAKWVAGDESHAFTDADTLQDWAAQHAPRAWMMGITVIDAAEALAIEPRPVDEWRNLDWQLRFTRGTGP